MNSRHIVPATRPSATIPPGTRSRAAILPLTSASPSTPPPDGTTAPWMRGERVDNRNPATCFLLKKRRRDTSWTLPGPHEVVTVSCGLPDGKALLG